MQKAGPLEGAGFACPILRYARCSRAACQPVACTQHVGQRLACAPPRGGGGGGGCWAQGALCPREPTAAARRHAAMHGSSAAGAHARRRAGTPGTAGTPQNVVPEPLTPAMHGMLLEKAAAGLPSRAALKWPVGGVHVRAAQLRAQQRAHAAACALDWDAQRRAGCGTRHPWGRPRGRCRACLPARLMAGSRNEIVMLRLRAGCASDSAWWDGQLCTIGSRVGAAAACCTCNPSPTAAINPPHISPMVVSAAVSVLCDTAGRGICTAAGAGGAAGGKPAPPAAAPPLADAAAPPALGSKNPATRQPRLQVSRLPDRPRAAARQLTAEQQPPRFVDLPPQNAPQTKRVRISLSACPGACTMRRPLASLRSSGGWCRWQLARRASEACPSRPAARALAPAPVLLRMAFRVRSLSRFSAPAGEAPTREKWKSS